MRSAIGVHVDAPPEVVFRLAAQVRRWPELLPHYRRVTVHAERAGRLVAQMVAVRRFGRFAMPVTWRAEQWAEGDDAGDLRLRFRHVRGVTRGMDVTWHIRPGARGEATAYVSIEHVFRRPLPLLPDALLPAFIDRFFTRPIAGRTLDTFKALAEREARRTVGEGSG
jgi:ribosome-associated toxin RatA of RatAB toxin-antitoxin module